MKQKLKLAEGYPGIKKKSQKRNAASTTFVLARVIVVTRLRDGTTA